MFDDLFGELEGTFSDIVESDVFQPVIYVVMAYVVLIWLASAYWAYRDMSLRTTSAITPYVAALAIILFTPIFFLFGLLLYRIVRPKETIGEVNERALAEEAMLAEVAAHAQCANCSRPVHEDWIICPTCRNRLRRVCPNCEHLIELDWTLCAWCGKDFERAEAPGTTAFIPSARPLPRPPQPAPRLQAPPPPPGRPAPATSAPARSKPADSTDTQRNPAPPTQPQGSSGPAPRSSGAQAASPGSGAQPSSGAQGTTGI
jgi:RNA polymerase subunit RPABC4/transcription elongation factor Spt4